MYVFSWRFVKHHYKCRLCLSFTLSETSTKNPAIHDAYAQQPSVNALRLPKAP